MYYLFILLGYLSGSILYAQLIPRLLNGIDIREAGIDHNPGAFNAFKLAGRKTGAIVLILELAKGFLPIYAAAHILDVHAPLFGIILAAPVIGHAFPFMHPTKGGKAIAVSFGCLLGLLPNLSPFFLLAFFYLLFSLLIIIRPHLLRTIITYLCFSITSLRHLQSSTLRCGTLLISSIVILKHLLKHEKSPISIRLPGRQNH